MKGYTFDPSRLRDSAKQQEKQGYRVVGQMLREYLGGDPLAEVRRRARRDPKLRAMFAAAAADLALAVAQIEPMIGKDGEDVGERALSGGSMPWKRRCTVSGFSNSPKTTASMSMSCSPERGDSTPTSWNSAGVGYWSATSELK